MTEQATQEQGPTMTAEPAKPLGKPEAPLSPAQWVVVGVMLTGLCLIVWALKRQAAIMKSSKSQPAVKSNADDTTHVDMQDLTRALISELDRKSASLETLLGEADRKIKALKAAANESAQHDPVKSRVFEMADQGASALEIARATGLPTGQVELMLGLRRFGG